jgi:hypothetical protein
VRHIKKLNDYSGLFLLVIAVAACTGVRMLRIIGNHIECRHEDHDKVTSAHEWD